MDKKIYISPAIEVIEVQIEQGFAATGGEGQFNVPDGFRWGNGGWI